MFSFTVQVLIVYAQIRGSQDMLSTRIFWAARCTIISTALNPFVYGILARRYRRAYFYAVRSVFSKCCSCVAAPQQNAFSKFLSHSFFSSVSRKNESIFLITVGSNTLGSFLYYCTLYHLSRCFSLFPPSPSLTLFL